MSKITSIEGFFSLKFCVLWRILLRFLEHQLQLLLLEDNRKKQLISHLLHSFHVGNLVLINSKIKRQFSL